MPSGFYFFNFGLLFGFVLLLLPVPSLLAFAFGGLDDGFFDEGGTRSDISSDSDGIHTSPNDSYSFNGDGVFFENNDCIFNFKRIHNNCILVNKGFKVWVIFEKAVEPTSIMTTSKANSKNE